MLIGANLACNAARALSTLACPAVCALRLGRCATRLLALGLLLRLTRP